jgi:hypothetical protein
MWQIIETGIALKAFTSFYTISLWSRQWCFLTREINCSISNLEYKGILFKSKGYVAVNIYIALHNYNDVIT